jgi:hypothetical protein
MIAATVITAMAAAAMDDVIETPFWGGGLEAGSAKS